MAIYIWREAVLITEYDEIVGINDVYFEGDICENCKNQNYCILIKALQTNMVVLDDFRPITECCFYI